MIKRYSFPMAFYCPFGLSQQSLFLLGARTVPSIVGVDASSTATMDGTLRPETGRAFQCARCHPSYWRASPGRSGGRGPGAHGTGWSPSIDPATHPIQACSAIKPGWVIAPSAADETSAAYLAKTPLV